jgi:hypothetical protein
VKSLLRKLKARNYLDLIDAITDAMLQVTKKDIHNWFAHCCYCTSWEHLIFVKTLLLAPSFFLLPLFSWLLTPDS